MLVVKFLQKELESYNDTVVIASDGKISCPSFPNWGQYSFEGSYNSYDTVQITINVGGGMGGYETYKTICVREK